MGPEQRQEPRVEGPQVGAAGRRKAVSSNRENRGVPRTPPQLFPRPTHPTPRLPARAPGLPPPTAPGSRGPPGCSAGNGGNGPPRRASGVAAPGAAAAGWGTNWGIQAARPEDAAPREEAGLEGRRGRAGFQRKPDGSATRDSEASQLGWSAKGSQGLEFGRQLLPAQRLLGAPLGPAAGTPRPAPGPETPPKPPGTCSAVARNGQRSGTGSPHACGKSLPRALPA